MISATPGKVIGEIIKDQEISKGGIILAKYLKEKAHKARAISVGKPSILLCKYCDEKKLCKKPCEHKGELIPVPVEVGDIVHFKPVFGTKIRYEDKDYIILRTLEIVGTERG